MASPVLSTSSFPYGTSLHVTVNIEPSNVQAFFSAFESVFEKVIAEDECTFFEVYHDSKNPGVISWVENWNTTPEWLMSVQIKKDYYMEYFKVTEPMFLVPREVRVLAPMGPKFSMHK